MVMSTNSIRRMDFTISLRPVRFKTHEYSVDMPYMEKHEYRPHDVESTVEVVRQFLDSEVDQYCFQVENTYSEYNETYEDQMLGNIHIQGRLNIKRRMRTKQMLDKLEKALFNTPVVSENIRLSPTANANTNFSYVMKEETRMHGPYCDRDAESYLIEDPLENKTLFVWQNIVLDKWLTKEGRTCYNKNGRKILFVEDRYGNVGKSTLVKHLGIARQKEVCVLPVQGSPSQLTAALIDNGPYPYYVLDLPRVKPADPKWLQDILFVIEQLQNGFIVNCMYGKYRSLVMKNPNILIFSNWPLPKLMSDDRYVILDPKTCQKDDLDYLLTGIETQ